MQIHPSSPLHLPIHSFAYTFSLLDLWSSLSCLTLFHTSSEQKQYFVPVCFHLHDQITFKALAVDWCAHMNTKKKKSPANSKWTLNCSYSYENNCLRECDTSFTQGMIWMLSTHWHMHERRTRVNSWKWDYNTTAAAKNNIVRWIEMHALPCMRF